MFINISNKPAAEWDEKQLAAAGGRVIDVPFPDVPPTATEKEVAALAATVAEEVSRRNCEFWENLPEDAAEPDHPDGVRVLVQGELSLCAELCIRLAYLGYTPVVATGETVSVDLGDGKKADVLKFVKFRRIRV